MRYPRGRYHPRAFQFDWLIAQVVEKSDTVTQQDGHQIDTYFVNQSGPDALLRNIRAVYNDVLVTCDCFCLFNGALDAVRDEGEGRSCLDPFLGDGMSHHKDRDVQGMSATPPMGEVELSPSRHQRPCRFNLLPKEFGALR